MSTNHEKKQPASMKRFYVALVAVILFLTLILVWVLITPTEEKAGAATTPPQIVAAVPAPSSDAAMPPQNLSVKPEDITITRNAAPSIDRRATTTGTIKFVLDSGAPAQCGVYVTNGLKEFSKCATPCTENEIKVKMGDSETIGLHPFLHNRRVGDFTIIRLYSDRTLEPRPGIRQSGPTIIEVSGSALNCAETLNLMCASNFIGRKWGMKVNCQK